MHIHMYMYMYMYMYTYRHMHMFFASKKHLVGVKMGQKSDETLWLESRWSKKLMKFHGRDTWRPPFWDILAPF